MIVLSACVCEKKPLSLFPITFSVIDLSDDAWFDLDLLHYQDQLVNGYTRMTPLAGLQIFMPDLDALKKKKASKEINIEWMKNRNISPPPDVTPKYPYSFLFSDF